MSAPRRALWLLPLLFAASIARAHEAPPETGAEAPEIPPEPVCEGASILGAVLAPIEGPGECGVPDPVRVTSVAGVALSPEPEITCGTAEALEGWLEDAAQPAFAEAGARLEGLRIAAGYVCRNRNRADTGPLSEHALGRALDISEFRLDGDRTITVLQDWDAPAFGPVLQSIYGAACGRFGTTLGPEANELHRDHFHFDIAERRNPYCR